MDVREQPKHVLELCCCAGAKYKFSRLVPTLDASEPDIVTLMLNWAHPFFFGGDKRHHRQITNPEMA